MYSIWLTLKPEAADAVSGDISALADVTGGPIFEPHMTFYGDMNEERDSAKRIALSLAEVCQDAAAQVKDVSFGETYFQSVFLELELPERLAAFRLSYLAQYGVTPAYPPHISIAYGVEDHSELDPQLAKIRKRYQGKELVFDELVLMASSEDRPVEHWMALDRIPLR